MDMHLEMQQPAPNGREQVYETIRANILELRLYPGCPINESDLSRVMGVSRTPIREAFVRLKRDHLVVAWPQRGSYVSKIDMRLVREGSFMRGCLEKAIFRRLAASPQPYLVQELRKYYGMQQAIVDSKDDFALEFMSYDNRFHECIFEADHMENVWNSIITMNTHFNRLRYLDLRKRVNISNILSQHQRMIDIIETGETSGIDALVDEHQGNVMGIVGELRREYPDYFLEEDM